jgi:hypothetical protein
MSENTSNSEPIITLLKGIHGGIIAGISSSSAAADSIKQFAKFYFQRKSLLERPQFKDNEISLLLYGSKELNLNKGLIESCGLVSLTGELRASSILCVELLLMLLDNSVNPNHAQTFLQQLYKVNIKQLQAIKLEKHILENNENPNVRLHAFQLIQFFSQQLSDININQYIQSQQAIHYYQEWLIEYGGNKEEVEGNSSDEEVINNGPSAWSQVKLDKIYDELSNNHTDEAVELLLAEQEKKEADQDKNMKDPLGLIEGSLNEFESQLNQSSVSSEPGSSRNRPKLRTKSSLWRKVSQQKQRMKALKSKVSSVEPESSGNDLGGQLDLFNELFINTNDAGYSSYSINPSQEDFDSLLFLATIHNSTSFRQLHQGLEHLESSGTDRTQQLKQLINQHFAAYIYCKQTTDHLHDLLQSEVKQNNKTARAAKLQAELTALSTAADQLFEPLLGRKQEAERIRSTLHSLQQFKFIFQIPGEMKKNMKLNQLDKVCRDYNKAKSIKQQLSRQRETNQSSQLLNKVIEEIFKLIAQLREKLLNELNQEKNELHMQANHLHVLLQLDCEFDPVQFYLNKRIESIISKLQATITKQYQKLHNSNVETNPDISSQIQVLVRECNERVSWLVRRLCFVLFESLPGFLQSLQSLSSSKFLGKSSSIDLSPLLQRLYSTFSTYIAELMLCPQVNSASYTDLGLLTFPPNYPQAVNTLFTCYEGLKKLPHSSSRLNHCKSELSCVELVCGRVFEYFVHWTARNCWLQLQNLSRIEKYGVVRKLEQAVAVTHFIANVEEIFDQMMQSFEAVPSISSREQSQLFIANYFECCNAVADAAHQLLFYNTATNIKPHTRLLLILSNILWLNDHTLPNLLIRATDRISAVDSDVIDSLYQNNVLCMMETLEHAAFQALIKQKTLQINSELNNSFFASGINWCLQEESTVDMRPCIYSVLLNLVELHSEIFTIRPKELHIILQSILLALINSYSAACYQIQSFSLQSTQLLLLELFCIQAFLQAFLNEEINEAIKRLEEWLRGGSDEEELSHQTLSQLFSSIQSSNSLIFLCFQPQAISER